MEAEAAALSQLQLQLLALVSDHRLARERERAAREELRASTQRWKEAEEGHRREARELRAEVADRDDALRRLESRVKSIENDNEQLERNEKDLKENMETLLQSREAFIKQYEDSACSLQWTIQMKDKQIAVISEKLNSHLALFNSVGKEVVSVTQVLGDVESLVGEKENVVSELKGKVQRISVLEKDFVEKLSFLRDKISSYQLELRNRARIIYELKEKLDAEKINNKFHPQVEEKSLLVKDEIIERLTSDKQAMLKELHNMEIAIYSFWRLHLYCAQASVDDSACSLQWTIQMKDKQIAVISEKLNSHLALFNSVGKEVVSVTQVLGDVESLVGEKENVVSELKGKVQRISVLEKDFVEKLSFLRDKISSYQLELRNRARIIYELKEKLDAEKINNKFHPQVEEKSLLVKDEIIERLTSDKQAMLKELHNMEIALGKFQDIFGSIGHEEIGSSSPLSECQDRQYYANKEQVESIPGSQCGPPNEHTLIQVIDEAASAKVECRSRVDTGSNQEQSPQSLMHPALASPEPVAETAETPKCCHESKDMEMRNSSPEQQTNHVNPNLETENQP